MEYKKYTNDNYDAILSIVISVLLVLMYYIVVGMDVYKGERALYADDLNFYTMLSDDSVSWYEKIFCIDGNKFRFPFYAVALVVFNVTGNNFEMLDSILWINNIVTAFFFFGLTCWLIKSKMQVRDVFLACLATLMYASSRFSYYTMTEVLGIMESMATVLTLAFVVVLIKDNFQFRLKYWVANALYVTVIFVHARYFVLVGVLLVYIIIDILEKKNIKKDIKYLVITAMYPPTFFGLRYYLFGGEC